MPILELLPSLPPSHFPYNNNIHGTKINYENEVPA
jgi:hypothetical protein